MGAVCINLHQRSAIRAWVGFIDPLSLLAQTGDFYKRVAPWLSRSEWCKDRDHSSACLSASALASP